MSGPSPASLARHLAARVLLRAGLAAAALSAILNSLIYLAAAPLGWFPREVLTPAGEPITLPAVIVASALGALGASAAWRAPRRRPVLTPKPGGQIVSAKRAVLPDK